MSLRLEMLQVARLAPKLLVDSAELVRDFLLRHWNDDGGFTDRSGTSDLYYSVFGFDSLIALQASPPAGRLFDYLQKFGDGEGLDFVHLCCLARCLAAVGSEFSAKGGSRWMERLQRFRSADGGYHSTPGNRAGSVYGCFLAFGACQDLRLDIPKRERLLDCLERLRTPDGAWANEPGMKIGSTNATAAAVTLLRHLDADIPSAAADWLLARLHPQGGFRAAPAVPLPDLLSTATALHALSGLQCDVNPVREPCLDFLDSLWTNEGSFFGHWGEEVLDCEYTFYGLLALGHLAV